MQQVFDMFGKRAQGKTCPAIDGIIAEGKEILDEFRAPALDVGVVSTAQLVEHYEITRYGDWKRWAEELGMKDAVKFSRPNIGRRIEDPRSTDRNGRDLRTSEAKAAS
jgi:ferritin-like metal-binding protein YciE